MGYEDSSIFYGDLEIVSMALEFDLVSNWEFLLWVLAEKNFY